MDLLMEPNLKSVTKDETAAKDPKVNNEISLIDLIELIKKAFKDDDTKTGFFYLNLVMLSPSLDMSAKMALLSLGALAHFKTKNVEALSKVVRKIFKYSNKESMKQTPPEIMAIFIKILQKTALIFEEKGDLMHACWFLYLAKNIYDGYDLKGDEQTYEFIKNSFPQVMSKISDYVNY